MKNFQEICIVAVMHALLLTGFIYSISPSLIGKSLGLAGISLIYFVIMLGYMISPVFIRIIHRALGAMFVSYISSGVLVGGLFFGCFYFSQEWLGLLLDADSQAILTNCLSIGVAGGVLSWTMTKII